MRQVLFTVVFVALSSPALASDGVLEINQTCAVQTGCFAGDTARFPVTISQSGSYRLTSNLVVPNEFTDAIVVGTNDVGIDLNNFAIIRSGCEGVTTDCTPVSGSAFGSGVERVTGSERGLSVKNGSIIGMGAYGVRLGEQAEVTNLRVRWSRLDGINVADGSTVSGNTAYQNGSEGIFGLSGSTVSGNTAYQNGGAGIFGLFGVTMIGNTAYDNGDAMDVESGNDGIECLSGCLVRGNTVRGNSGHGLELGSDSAYSDNVVTGNLTGTVSGGNSRGGNYCAGTGVASAFCP